MNSKILNGMYIRSLFKASIRIYSHEHFVDPSYINGVYSYHHTIFSIEYTTTHKKMIERMKRYMYYVTL